MPFEFAVRQAQASPSVSLEKGAYRMRAPARRSGLGGGLSIDTTLANNGPRIHARPRRTSSGMSRDGLPLILHEERRLAMLVVLLVCCVVSCFGGAYYLFSTSPRI